MQYTISDNMSGVQGSIIRELFKLAKDPNMIAFGGGNREVFLGKDYGQVRNYSESVASEIDAEIEDIIRNAYGRTETILTEHMDKLHIVAQKLFENEKMTGEEFAAIMTETASEASEEEITE